MAGPKVFLDPKSPTFKTPDGAADAVSRDFAKQDLEQAAVVIRRPDGSYSYSTVAPSSQHDHFELRAMLPKDHSLAGIVHSHPGSDDLGQVFSPDDLGVASQLKVPSFIRFNKDNSIRRYTPGTTATQMLQAAGNKFGLKTAVGDPIAQEPAYTQPGTQDQSADPSAGVLARDDSVTSH